MGTTKRTSRSNATSRRDFIKKSSFLFAGGAVGGPLSLARGAHAYGSDTIRLGVIGCGARGTVAAQQALGTPGGEVRLIAMADVFADRIHACYRSLKGKFGANVDVPRERRFSGLDAYRQLLQTDTDLVILAAPPGFRPLHFEAAVNAAKHVFMEKPVATDAPGVRRVLDANAAAHAGGLAVAVGLQRRHELAYQECVAKLQGGAIGDIILSRAYWTGGAIRDRLRGRKQTELEHQLRNWQHFSWLSGDHIVEQHVQNLDVINWVMDGPPASAQGQGGLLPTDRENHGQVFDQHFVEFTYASGAKMLSQCRRVAGCWNSVAEHAHGARGRADISGGKIYDTQGKLAWQTHAPRGGHQQQHLDLFAALRSGEPPNEGEYAAYSAMTAIMGRMATYSGQVVTWDQAIVSDRALADVDRLESLDDEAPVSPNRQGAYAVALPGSSSVL